jgi:imidazolonepropionase-like amidohydrolase
MPLPSHGQDEGDTVTTGSVTLRAPRVWLGDTGSCVENGAVTIADGRVSAIVHAGEPTPDGSPVVDYPGCTILPGLIDAHVHLLFSASDQALGDAIHDSDQTLILRGIANAQDELRCGVTTLRDCGGRGLLTLSLRDAVSAGIVAGPRILASGAPITTTGGHLNFCNLEADGVDEVTKTTRRLCKAGVDFIKVMATGGGMTPGTNPRAPQYTTEELSAIVREARRLGGRRVAAHCHATEGIIRAVDAGITTIEHCSWLHAEDGRDFRPEVVQRMVDRGTYVVLTMGSERAAVKPESELTEAQKANVRGWGEHLDLQRRTVQGGVRFIAASDAGVARTFFREYPLTLEVMSLLLGIEPEETLVATTSRSAEALGLESSIGRLRPGMAGDIVVVRGDPLVSIRAMREVEAVYRDGRLLVERGRLV